MPRKTSRQPLKLSDDEKDKLQKLSNSQTQPVRKVKRARILLMYASGDSISKIGKAVGLSRDSVYKWIDRALALGPTAALEDKYHRPHEPTITPEAKVWVIEIACTKPKNLGYAAELWTLRPFRAGLLTNRLVSMSQI